MCCHPELPATQQIALALRIVCGLTVPEIARAFLVTDVAMEQRITRAKKHVAAERISFETPGAPERAERLSAVAAVLYVLFNEGYSATGGSAHVRVPLCDEAIRLARLLLRLSGTHPAADRPADGEEGGRGVRSAKKRWSGVSAGRRLVRPWIESD